LFGILGLVALEVYLRLTEPHIILARSRRLRGVLIEQDAEYLTHFTHRGKRVLPNVDVIVRNHHLAPGDVRIRTNALGFRDRDLPGRRRPGEVRALVLGDSITFAGYLPAEQTYVERAEHYLNATDGTRRFEVVNAGIGGAGLREQVDLLEEKGLGIGPDVVVVGFYMNDSQPPFGFAQQLGSRGWLRRNSMVAETVYRKLKLRGWVREHGTAIDWGRHVDAHAWRTRREEFLALAHVARFDWGAAWEQEPWNNIDRELARLASLSAEFVEDRPQRLLEEKARARGFHYRDLLPLFREHADGDFLLDWCHPGPRAHDLVGRELAALLREIAAGPPVDAGARRPGT
jgi:hypothetical protein